MLTLKQRLKAILIEFRQSEILDTLADLNTELAHDAAQDGRFDKERFYKNNAAHFRVDARALQIDEQHKYQP